MKKIALTSLIAVFAATGANAANIINNNPLYRPMEKQFYSVTDLRSHSEDTNKWTLGEEFGYGLTDRMAVGIYTNATETDTFDKAAWDEFQFSLNYRAVDYGNWKADIYGVYGLSPVWGDHRPFLDEDDTMYGWTAGVRGGYAAADWTLAAHLEYAYLNTESFNWGDDGVRALSVGVDGQLILCPKWNLTAGVEYTGILSDKYFGGVKVKDAGRWTGEFGINYNIDNDMYVGAFVNGEIAHATGDWEFEDGFGFGLKFGAQF